MAVRAVPGVGAMLVSLEQHQSGQERIEGLCELKTQQNFPSTINCLLPFFSDTSDRVDTPDVLARKGSLFSFLLAIVYSFCSEKHEGYCGSGIPQYSSSNDTV